MLVGTIFVYISLKHFLKFSLDVYLLCILTTGVVILLRFAGEGAVCVCVTVLLIYSYKPISRVITMFNFESSPSGSKLTPRL